MSTSIETDTKIPVAGSVNKITKRVSGKNWKLQKTATVRTQQPKSLRQSGKKELKNRKREINLERKRIEEEKARQEALAAKMSAKRLARMKKKELRKKARV
ncbi:unnamed protein product [Cunninghamella echinulata]